MAGKPMGNDILIDASFLFLKVGAEVKMDKLRLLASEPKFNNSFYIDDYSGLAGLLDNLQTKIFNIEGKHMQSHKCVRPTAAHENQ